VGCGLFFSEIKFDGPFFLEITQESLKPREASNATRPSRQVCSVLRSVICLIMSLHCSSLSVFVALPINAEAALPAMPPLGVQSNPQACLGGANFADNYQESLPSLPSLSLRFEV